MDAVLAGERNSAKLAALRDGRIKATEATIIKSLVGDYRREHLFTLRQCLAAWRNYQNLMADEPSFNLRGHLYRIFGIDLTAVPGISVLTARTLLAGGGAGPLAIPQ